MFAKVIIFLFVTSQVFAKDVPMKSSCILPPYPRYGSYEVVGKENAKPGQAFDSVYLKITCIAGFNIEDERPILCVLGQWSSNIPECKRLCKLNKHSSVSYRCLTGNNTIEDSRECNEYEPNGLIVRPKCNAPHYYSSGVLPNMQCIEGSWDYVAICNSECGRADLKSGSLLVDEISPEQNEFPWHVAVFTKTTDPYRQICAGSLISTKVVISVAHCFWNHENKVVPASNYALAVGKLYRSWDDPHDKYAQKSDIQEIKIPLHFHGQLSNFQDDIAMVVASKSFQYNMQVQPVCMDFDPKFEQKQLKHGAIGKVPSWESSLTGQDKSSAFQIKNVTFLGITQCVTKLTPEFRSFITSDKMCGEFGMDDRLCLGNSGAGAVFADEGRGITRYYLRGIVSTAPRSKDYCLSAIAGLTQISKHEDFIHQNLIL